MKFSILSQQTVIGVLPYDAMLSGSTDLGDVLNSWITYVNKALKDLPTHPLAILNKSIPTIINSASTLADSFRLEVAPQPENDGVVVFKGIEYYIVDYETEDATRTEVTLSCIKKSVMDIGRQERDDVVQLDTLDLLFAFVTGQLSTALNNAVFAKQVTSSPVGVAAPAQPIAWPTIEAELKKPQQVPIKKPVVNAITPSNDVAAAQAALSALLRKGSL